MDEINFLIQSAGGLGFLSPFELRRDLSHNGDMEVGEKCVRTNGTCWGTWGRAAPTSYLLQTASQGLCSESCHEINLHNKNVSLSALFDNHREASIQQGGEAGHTRGLWEPQNVTEPQPRGTENFAMKNEQQLFRSCFSSPHLIEKAGGEKGEKTEENSASYKGEKKDRRKTQKLLCQRKWKY